MKYHKQKQKRKKTNELHQRWLDHEKSLIETHISIADKFEKEFIDNERKNASILS